ncbi:Slp family lipoprotein [Candidatus Nitrospira allomarina]|uniref:Slp family lipoprotein n=1 Tax=Candidatus Nitrospira allomarina TaxID=3020900 RepID=A0AA96GB10_9BACT|nr:Slp family lipoprotein [Candidatus Nitrospira allomarina]WNM58022.1 Slp family lipoprotein [Candidatus Nitrospira allomarina]
MKIGMRCIHLAVLLVGLSGCATFSSSPFSTNQEAKVMVGASFANVNQDPSAHIGQILKVGGVVLSAKRLVDRTEVMVLQIPLDSDSVPKWDRTKSQGRFIATQQPFLDPATLPEGTRVTIIGEVTGQASVRVDEEEKVYPVLAIQALKVWPMIPRNTYGYGPYWGPYPYWGRNWGWYWPYSPYAFGYGRRNFGGRGSWR